MKYIVFAIIGLAIIGLVGQLFTNPGNFLRSILMMIGFAVIVGGLLYYFMYQRGGQSQNAKYRKAVRQSKKKYGSPQSNQHYIKKPAKIRHSEARAHLRVIKGNKK